MQLDEQIQQHVVSLPIELKAEVLYFVLYLEQKRERQAQKNLVEKIIVSEKEHLPPTQNLIGALINIESYSIEEDNTQEILEMVRNIKPVKFKYTSEQIVRSLRDGTILE